MAELASTWRGRESTQNLVNRKSPGLVETDADEEEADAERIRNREVEIREAALKKLGTKTTSTYRRPTVADFPQFASYIQAADDMNAMTTAATFQGLIMTLIFIAVLLMGVQTYPGYETGKLKLMTTADTILLVLFSFECIAKIVACSLRPWRYFYGHPDWEWNCFDFAVVMMSYPWPGITASLGSTFKMMRILRIIKLLNKIPKLYILISALRAGMMSILYIFVLILILFYFYAIAGVLYFQANDPWHFKSFSRAMLTLFTMMTLNDWSGIFYINYFGCEENPHTVYTMDPLLSKFDGDDVCTAPQPQHMASIIYFITFIMQVLIPTSLYFKNLAYLA
jgi:voltage-gated sodium channel